MEDLIYTVLVGLVAGWLAGQVMKGGGYGVFVDIILGILGGVIGGWVFGLLGLHAGGFETALMLHLRPDLVRKDKIRDFPSKARALERDFPSLAAQGRLAFAWQAQDLNSAGAVGDARLGTAEMGRKLVESAAVRLVKLVDEPARLPPEAVDRRS